MENLKYAAEIEILRGKLAEYSRENAELRFQRDIAMAKMESLIPVATPEEEEQMMKDLQSATENLSDVIAEMDKMYG